MLPVTLHNTSLVFLAYEYSRAEAVLSNIGILNLRTSLQSAAEVKNALVSAVTQWVNTTEEGRSLWNYSCANLNIGDLHSSSAFNSVAFIDVLKQYDIEYLGCTVGDLDVELSYDDVLVDSSKLIEQMAQSLHIHKAGNE
jgi:hypothetical protein